MRLVGTHRTRPTHNGNGLFPVLCVLEHQKKAVPDHLFRGGGVVFHCSGFKQKIRLCTEVLDGHHQHISPQVLHAASLVKKDMQLIGEVRVAAGGFCGSGRFRRRNRRRRSRDRCRSFWRVFPFNFGNQAINIFKKGVDIFIKGLAGLYLFHFRAEVVNGLKHQIKEAGPVFLGDNRHGIFTDNKKQVLDSMGNGCQ